MQVHNGKKSIFASFRQSLLRESHSQMMMLSVKQCKLNEHFVKKITFAVLMVYTQPSASCHVCTHQLDLTGTAARPSPPS